MLDSLNPSGLARDLFLSTIMIRWLGAALVSIHYPLFEMLLCMQSIVVLRSDSRGDLASQSLPFNKTFEGFLI